MRGGPPLFTAVLSRGSPAFQATLHTASEIYTVIYCAVTADEHTYETGQFGP